LVSPSEIYPSMKWHKSILELYLLGSSTSLTSKGESQAKEHLIDNIVYCLYGEKKPLLYRIVSGKRTTMGPVPAGFRRRTSYRQIILCAGNLHGETFSMFCNICFSYERFHFINSTSILGLFTTCKLQS
jgi:hypothetical protein